MKPYRTDRDTVSEQYRYKEKETETYKEKETKKETEIRDGDREGRARPREGSRLSQEPLSASVGESLTDAGLVYPLSQERDARAGTKRDAAIPISVGFHILCMADLGRGLYAPWESIETTAAGLASADVPGFYHREHELTIARVERVMPKTVMATIFNQRSGTFDAQPTRIYRSEVIAAVEDLAGVIDLEAKLLQIGRETDDAIEKKTAAARGRAEAAFQRVAVREREKALTKLSKLIPAVLGGRSA